MTKKYHKNGTERIAEAYKKIGKKYDLIVDIQGDEPLIDPKHIDRVIDFHFKNIKTDIVVPNLRIKEKKNLNIVKVVQNSQNDVVYLSRLDIPLNLKKSTYI